MRLKDISTNELLKGSLILLILTNIGNVFSYLFQFLMARLLGPVEYGTLAVITSIIAVFAIPSVSIQTVTAKKTAEYKAQGKFSQINGLLKTFLRKSLKVSVICFILFIGLSFFISKYLSIQLDVLILTGVFLFGAFLYPVGSGILQGMKKFTKLGLIYMINTLLKLVIGVGLVLIGFRIYGAVLAFILGTLISFIIILPMIKEVFQYKGHGEERITFSRNNWYTLVAMIIIVLMYSLDVFFAKGFFSAEIAGKYAVISMIGKIILFVNLAIGNVMLPINTERFLNGNRNKNVINKTVFLIFGICCFSLVLFYFFPEMIVKILFGEEYSSMYPILFYTGITFSVISFLNIFVLYIISENRISKKHIFWLFFFLLFQGGVMYYYHSTINEFVFAFMCSNIITFIGILFVSKKWNFQ
jgi:O-antigen/teichoic acid export membrane protein